MECPSCKEKYSFRDVPFESRNVKFLVTEFICPFCDVWITPTKAYGNILSGFVALTTISVILILLGKDFSSIFMWFGITLSFISFILLISSKFTLKYEIKKQT